MIAALKRSSFALSRRLGVSRLVARSDWRRQRLLILCYHGISLDDEHRWNHTLYVPATHFERHLSLLQRNDCSVLPLGEAVERLYARDLPECAVALTFDDGYFDFKARAWPLLRTFGYPATVYLTTARVEHNFPIVNLFISYMLWRAREQRLDGRGIAGLEGMYGLTTSAERQRVVDVIDRTNQALGLSATQKDAVAKAIADRLALDYESLVGSRVVTLLRPDEAAELATQGLDVQMHTHLHRTPPDVGAFMADLGRNGDVIERITGSRPTHLCYPSGMYRSTYLPALRRMGLASATTCDPGIAADDADPLLLPRFMDTSVISDLEFEAWISGVATRLPRRTTKAQHGPLAMASR